MSEQSVLSPSTGATSPPTRLMLIGGNWVEAADDEWREIASPARRGSVIARVPRGNATNVDRAVAAAREAFPAWRDQHFTGRRVQADDPTHPSPSGTSGPAGPSPPRHRRSPCPSRAC